MIQGITPAQALSLKRLADTALKVAGGEWVGGAQREIDALMREIDRLTVQPKRYVTTGEAARALGVSVRTVQLWIDAKRMPCENITNGGHRRIEQSVVDAMLASKTKEIGDV